MTKATKRIALKAEQATDLRDAFNSLEESGEIVAEMIEKLAKKQAKARRLVWESVAELLGAKRDLFLGGHGVDARFNHLTNEIIVDGSEEDLEAALPHLPLDS